MSGNLKMFVIVVVAVIVAGMVQKQLNKNKLAA